MIIDDLILSLSLFLLFVLPLLVLVLFLLVLSLVLVLVLFRPTSTAKTICHCGSSIGLGAADQRLYCYLLCCSVMFSYRSSRLRGKCTCPPGSACYNRISCDPAHVATPSGLSDRRPTALTIAGGIHMSAGRFVSRLHCRRFAGSAQEFRRREHLRVHLTALSLFMQ